MSRFFCLTIFVLSIFFSNIFFVEEVFAQEISGKNKYQTIIIDEQIIRSDLDQTSAQTVLKFIENNSEIENIYIGTFDSSSINLKFFEENNDDYKFYVNNLLSTLDLEKSDNSRSDQLGALTDIYSEYNKLNADYGSSVLIMTPGRISGESEKTRERFINVGELFELEKWVINVVTLPSTDIISRDLMSEISSSSMGEFFDLGILEGYGDFASYFNNYNLNEIMKTEIADNIPKLLPIEIAPYTEKFTLLVVRETFDTATSLFSPTGTKALAEMSNVNIFQTNNIILFTIENPSPGTWSIQTEGKKGKVIIYSEIINPLELKFIEMPPFSISEPVLIQAIVNINDSPKILPDGIIEAKVMNDLSLKTYKLNDSGQSGDKKSNDGIYSFEIIDTFEQGKYGVNLELTWPEFSSKIITSSSFQTEVFPKINITRTSNVEGSKDEELNLASITTTVADYPYLTNSKSISAYLSDGSNDYEANLVMMSEPEPGKSWKFDVVANIPRSGNYMLNILVEDNYLGRNFEISAPITEIEATIITYPIKLFGIRVIYILIILSIGVFIGLFVMIIRRKNSPYGYLIDDQGKVLVNFYNLERTPLNKIISKDFVSTSEVKSVPLSLGGFKFLPKSVELRLSDKMEDISVRVNGKPAPNTIKLTNRSQVGVGGKLFRFHKRLPKE